MYSLVKSIYSEWRRREEYGILIIGLDGAGKSTILEDFKFQLGLPSHDLSDIKPTVGQNYVCLQLNKKTRLIFWDLSGRQEAREMWQHYFAECHAILFVLDAADTSRLPDAFECLVLAANKSDLRSALTLEDLQILKDKRNISLDTDILSISALERNGISDLLSLLQAKVIENKRKKAKERPQ